MPIKATCSCGHAFAAPSKYAGKKVKCPECKEPLVLPAAKQPSANGPSSNGPSTKARTEPAKSAKLAVKCKCGKSFSAKPELAGKRVKCPGCSQPVLIKAASKSKTPASSDGMEDLFNEIGFNPDDGSDHRKCPECRSPMGAEAILCIQCGYNENLGKKMKVVRPVTADDRAKRADKVADNLESGGKKKKKSWWGRSK